MVVGNITYPVEVHNFIKKASERDVGLLITVRGGVDSIFSVINCVMEKRIRIMHVEWSEERDENSLLFMVLSEASDKIEELKNLFIANEYVSNVEMAPEFHDYIYCPYFFPIKASGERATLLEKDFLTKFVRNLYEMFIPEMIASFLYHIGKAYGYGIYDYYKSMVTNKELDSLIEYIQIFGLMSGGAIVERYEYADGEIKLYIRHNIECEIYRELGREEKSSFLRGILDSIFERHFSSKVVIKEVECITQGSNRCMFSVIPIKPG